VWDNEKTLLPDVAGTWATFRDTPIPRDATVEYSVNVEDDSSDEESQDEPLQPTPAERTRQEITEVDIWKTFEEMSRSTNRTEELLRKNNASDIPESLLYQELASRDDVVNLSDLETFHPKNACQPLGSIEEIRKVLTKCNHPI